MTQVEIEVVWKPIREFPGYSVSNTGYVRNDEADRLMARTVNNTGVAMVGLTRDAVQYRRSLALLVATAFIPQINGLHDTPINLNGDRMDCAADNLAWRPRWFAIEYNKQFPRGYHSPINKPIRNKKDHREVYPTSWECAQINGLLESDLVLSIINKTYVWPTYQEFEVIS